MMISSQSVNGRCANAMSTFTQIWYRDLTPREEVFTGRKKLADTGGTNQLNDKNVSSGSYTPITLLQRGNTQGTNQFFCTRVLFLFMMACQRVTHARHSQ